jgi:hypothetical protein
MHRHTNGQLVHATHHLSDDLVRGVLDETAAHDPVIARRLTLLALIWQETYQTQASLVARTESRLGRGCFGQNKSLAFRRDMQTIKAILAREGFSLRYSRQRKDGGYYIVGRPILDHETLKAIRGAADEVDPHQIAIFSRMTPAQRLRLAARLTNDLLAIATRQYQKEHPGLSQLDAQREVLHRTYQLPN